MEVIAYLFLSAAKMFCLKLFYNSHGIPPSLQIFQKYYKEQLISNQQ